MAGVYASRRPRFLSREHGSLKSGSFPATAYPSDEASWRIFRIFIGVDLVFEWNRGCSNKFHTCQEEEKKSDPVKGGGIGYCVLVHRKVYDGDEATTAQQFLQGQGGIFPLMDQQGHGPKYVKLLEISKPKKLPPHYHFSTIKKRQLSVSNVFLDYAFISFPVELATSDVAASFMVTMIATLSYIMRWREFQFQTRAQN